METTHLIVGLGNPGGEYERTRHNAGFLAVEELARRWQASWTLERKFDARLARAGLPERTVYLCEPQTYMNASGVAVAGVVRYFQIPLSQVLVVVDDADLPLGEIRLRERGSSGGHHGLESIQQHLGTRDYARLRIGIGRTEEGAREITDYVLGRFTAGETGILEKVLDRVAQQMNCWLSDGIQRAMNRFNGAVEAPGKKDN